jgi:hypothetical protein
MKYTAFALLFFSLFIIFNTTSCTTRNKYPKETQMLDSMQILVIKADSAVKQIDSVKISGYADHINKDVQMIPLYHADSMSAGASEIFKNLNSIRWSLLTVTGKKWPLLTELGKSQKQLSHLSHDINHNLVAADSVQFYVAYETKKASELVQVSAMSVDEVAKQLPLYDALAPKADSLISLLKEHKKF